MPLQHGDQSDHSVTAQSLTPTFLCSSSDSQAGHSLVSWCLQDRLSPDKIFANLIRTPSHLQVLHGPYPPYTHFGPVRSICNEIQIIQKQTERAIYSKQFYYHLVSLCSARLFRSDNFWCTVAGAAGSAWPAASFRRQSCRRRAPARRWGSSM